VYDFADGEALAIYYLKLEIERVILVIITKYNNRYTKLKKP